MEDLKELIIRGILGILGMAFVGFVTNVLVSHGLSLGTALGFSIFLIAVGLILWAEH